MNYRRKTTDWLAAAFLREEEECIEWPFARTSGYGSAQDKHGLYKPHRRICEWEHGPPPSAKHHAAHLCGNRACVNRKHLAWVTPAVNLGEHKRLQGRVQQAQPLNRQLSVDDVLNIRARADGGETLTEIARDYPVTFQAIKKIVTRKTYREVRSAPWFAEPNFENGN